MGVAFGEFCPIGFVGYDSFLEVGNGREVFSHMYCGCLIGYKP